MPQIVDPKIPHLASYAGASLITPNHHEAEVATHTRIRTDTDARDAARAFRALAGSTSVMITRGEHGLWLAEGAAPAPAMLAVALASGATLVQAAELANHAAGIAVGKFGPAAVTAAELLDALE